MTVKKTVFNSDWLNNVAWNGWLSRCVGDVHSARCSVCFKTFSLSNMGQQAVISHAASKNHIKNMSAAQQTPPVTAVISSGQSGPQVKEVVTSTTLVKKQLISHLLAAIVASVCPHTY
jgi:hypothetical protein